MTDPTVHGGTITGGSSNVFINGLAAACVADPHACPVVTPGQHLGGTIGKGSATVFFNGKSVARETDFCGCIMMVGVSGAGAPAASGPGAGGSGSGSPVSKKYFDGKAGTEDTDGDGTKDRAYAEGSALDVKRNYKLGDQDMEGYVKGGYGGGEAGTSGTDYGGKAKVKGEAGVEKVGTRTKADPKTGDHAGVEGDVLHAEGFGEGFIGDDGERIGIGGGGKLGAEVVGGKAYKTETYELFGYSVKVQEESSYAALALGAEGGGHAYYNKKTERFHLGGFLGIEAMLGFAVKGDVSIGKAGSGGGGGGAGGAPQLMPVGVANFIAKGSPNVFIGG